MKLSWFNFLVAGTGRSLNNKAWRLHRFKGWNLNKAFIIDEGPGMGLCIEDDFEEALRNKRNTPQPIPFRKPKL